MSYTFPSIISQQSSRELCLATSSAPKIAVSAAARRSADSAPLVSTLRARSRASVSDPPAQRELGARAAMLARSRACARAYARAQSAVVAGQRAKGAAHAPRARAALRAHFSSPVAPPPPPRRLINPTSTCVGRGVGGAVADGEGARMEGQGWGVAQASARARIYVRAHACAHLRLRLRARQSARARALVRSPARWPAAWPAGWLARSRVLARPRARAHREQRDRHGDRHPLRNVADHRQRHRRARHRGRSPRGAGWRGAPGRRRVAGSPAPPRRRRAIRV